MEILIHQSISVEKIVKVAVSHLKILWCTDTFNAVYTFNASVRKSTICN